MSNPIAYVEIPVSDLDRAIEFYSTVLRLDITREIVDGYEMGLFPADADSAGCSGALAKGDVYVPAKAGPVVYMRVDSIDEVLERAQQYCAPVLLERRAIGDVGFVAEIGDSEGNRIGLHEAGNGGVAPFRAMASEGGGREQRYAGC
ncbi:MAG: VOC family protein [Planctomycetota bacterium]